MKDRKMKIIAMYDGIAQVSTNDKKLDGKYWLNPHNLFRQFIFREPHIVKMVYVKEMEK